MNILRLFVIATISISLLFCVPSCTQEITEPAATSAPVATPEPAAVPTPAITPSPNQMSPDTGQSQPPQPDLAAAAAKLGITEAELKAALGVPDEGPPDLETSAAKLGITREELAQALGVSGDNGTPPAPSESGATSPQPPQDSTPVVPEPSQSGAYTVVDTGQDKCYNNSSVITAPSPGGDFCGQDAQYQGNQPSYTISTDGLTVYDNVTGLTWTRGADWTGDGVVDVDDKFTYDGAQSYVDTLNAEYYGGFSDWRVPSIKELYSLIDYRGTDPNPTAASSGGLVPFIDDDVFEFAYGDTSAGERIIDSLWVTGTLYISTVFNNIRPCSA